MLSFERESNLDGPVMRHLRRRRFHSIYREAPFRDYRIDLLGFSDTDGSCVAVELKLSRWQRAFEQALVYQLCADFAYVAMPRAKVGRIPLDRLREYGVGVIAVDGRGCTVVLPAQQSAVIRKEYKDRLIQRMRERL